MILNCIVVDDEPLARDLIAAYAEKSPSLNLLGKYSSGGELMQVLYVNEIDLIFLDIRMPDISGIELAKLIEQQRNIRDFRIVFTTAFDQYAIEGYKVDALDYLLKPISFLDFNRAVSKALHYFGRMRQVPIATQSAAIFAEPSVSEPQYIYLKVEYQLVRVPLDDILYIESLKDYVKVFRKGQPPLLSLVSMKAIEEKLPNSGFMRIHRSFIVALHAIDSTTRNSIQIDKVTIPVTDQYKQTFLAFLEGWK